jgi:hypothetical protein
MSVIQEAMKREGLKLVGDALPKKDRKVKVFQRVIAAIRAAEHEMQQELNRAQERLNSVLLESQAKDQKISRLEKEVLRHRVAEWTESVPAITTQDKTKLLELSQA